MARISVEQAALTDARFSVMAGILGVSRHDALGRMVVVWNQCQESGSYVLSAQIVNRMFDDAPALADVLVKSGLAKQHRHGLYICGTKGRIEWLTTKRVTARRNGKSGGRPRKAKRKPTKNQRRLRSESPPAPAPAPAPSPANGKRERTSSTTTRETATATPATRAALRMKAGEITGNRSLMQMAIHDPEGYEDAVKEITNGWSPAQVTELTGIDVLPHPEFAATEEESHASM